MRGPVLPARSSSAFEQKQVRFVLHDDVVCCASFDAFDQEAEAEARKLDSKREFKRQVCKLPQVPRDQNIFLLSLLSVPFTMHLTRSLPFASASKFGSTLSQTRRWCDQHPNLWHQSSVGDYNLIVSAGSLEARREKKAASSSFARQRDERCSLCFGTQHRPNLPLRPSKCFYCCSSEA